MIEDYESISEIQVSCVYLVKNVSNGVHTDRDIAVGLVGSRETFTVVQVINGYLYKIRFEGLRYSRIHLIAVIVKCSITGICIHAVLGVLEYGECSDLTGLLRPALTDTVILCGHWRRRYRSCRSRLPLILHLLTDSHIGGGMVTIIQENSRPCASQALQVM